LTYEFALIVDRGEAMRLLVYWDPTDGIEYVGSLSGQDFSVAGGFNRGDSFSIGCVSGGQVEVILTGRVWGRFSTDGRSIAAEEVLSYLVVRTGEQVDVRYPLGRDRADRLKSAASQPRRTLEDCGVSPSRTAAAASTRAATCCHRRHGKRGLPSRR
jgi:hypothetical protein